MQNRSTYLEKNRFTLRQIKQSPSAKLSISVVIPCFNETAILNTLQSLVLCDPPACDVEVIIVINASTEAEAAIVRQNEVTLAEALAWIPANTPAWMKMHVLSFNNLPPRHAGVGLARKIGMDEAADRFEQAGNPGGIILCLDADCTVSSNYLSETFSHFQEHPESPACSLYFEHPLTGPEDPLIYEGIARYELFLRYYTEALRYAGFPYAFHTIGSCMAVRSNVYQQQGGMNRRKAGEDFYFLHKLMPLGNFTEINSTTVFPSPRVSGRVPFGTGRAMGGWMQDPGSYETYSFQIFSDTKQLCLFLKTLPSSLNADTLLKGFQELPAPVWEFLKLQGIETKIAEILSNVSSALAFFNRFYRWFDGFMMLKYVHFCRDRYYANVPVEQAASELMRLIDPGEGNRDDALGLLMEYRRLQREHIG